MPYLSVRGEAQQVTADIPQPPSYRLVSSLGRDPCQMAVAEMVPTETLQPFGQGAVQAGLRPLLGSLDEEGEKPPHPSHESRVPNQLRVDRARVHRIRRHARAFQPPGQLPGEENVGQLAVAVGQTRVVELLALQVMEVDPSQVMCQEDTFMTLDGADSFSFANSRWVRRK